MCQNRLLAKVVAFQRPRSKIMSNVGQPVRFSDLERENRTHEDTEATCHLTAADNEVDHLEVAFLTKIRLLFFLGLF